MIERDRPPASEGAPTSDRGSTWVRFDRLPSARLRRTVGVALIPSERDRVERAAGSCGMTMSAWSRGVLLKELDRIEAGIEAGTAEKRAAKERARPLRRR